MRVYRVTSREEAQEAYPCATESPTPFWADGLPLSRAWFGENLGRHVEGLHLKDKTGQVIGHIYWAPSERALVPYRIEEGVAFLYCEWVQHQHQGRGCMQALFQAWVDFLHAERYKGILVDGTTFEGYMHFRHFAKRGFQTIREADGGRLMYLPLAQEKVSVEPLSPRIPREGVAPVEVVVIGSHFCPVGASAVLAIRRAAERLGPQVAVTEVPAGTETLAHYGVADGIFVNGRAMFFGPVTEEQVYAALKEELASGE
jgi:predicted N-acetyltransferase YhbS